METVRVDAVLDKDGEINVKGLPFKKGEHVELTISRGEQRKERVPLTGKMLLDSGLVGMWADRTDMGDSVEFARKLRERNQRRWR